jgi:hypothetical protein
MAIDIRRLSFEEKKKTSIEIKASKLKIKALMNLWKIELIPV